jgi:hypothetical protein
MSLDDQQRERDDRPDEERLESAPGDEGSGRREAELPSPADEPATGRSPEQSDEDAPSDLQLEPLEPEEDRRAAGFHAPQRDDSEGDRDTSIESLDVCPNCGATMTGADSLVCVRCGFDLKTMKAVKTEVGEEAPPEEEEEPAEPIAQSGSADPWLPLIAALIAALTIVIGLLAGAPGLFNQAVNEEGVREAVAWSERWLALLRLPVLIGLWTLCGFGGLAFTAYYHHRPIGEIPIAAARLLAICVVARLAGFIDLGPFILEFVLEVIAAIAIAFVLSMLFFRLKPREAGLFVGVTTCSFIGLYLISHLVVWVT